MSVEVAAEQLGPTTRSKWASALSGLGLWRRFAFGILAYGACAVMFYGFAIWQGASGSTLLHTMFTFSIGTDSNLQQTLVRSVPIVLAALACTIPARAGLVNIGGEGQIIIGAVACVGISILAGPGFTGPVAWIVMAVAGALGGALWAGICGWLRVRFHASESVTTLFLNFIANDIMVFFIFGPWKNQHSAGVPASRSLSHGQQLPNIFGLQINSAVVLMFVATAVVWWALEQTGWGLRLKVAGTNIEAAHRLGLPVSRILLGSMLWGGALAGLGGACVVMGTEGALRPGMTASFGFIAFLANFLGGSRPFAVLGAALLFGAVAMTGNGLQLVENMDGNAVNVLMSLIVLTTLVLAGRKRAAFE